MSFCVFFLCNDETVQGDESTAMSIEKPETQPLFDLPNKWLSGIDENVVGVEIRELSKLVQGQEGECLANFSGLIYSSVKTNVASMKIVLKIESLGDSSGFYISDIVSTYTDQPSLNEELAALERVYLLHLQNTLIRQ